MDLDSARAFWLLVSGRIKLSCGEDVLLIRSQGGGEGPRITKETGEVRDFLQSVEFPCGRAVDPNPAGVLLRFSLT